MAIGKFVLTPSPYLLSTQAALFQDERQRQAQKEIREQEEAAARGAEALKQRREDRMRQRALLAAQWREKHLRKAARMRGTLALKSCCAMIPCSSAQWDFVCLR